MIIKSACVSTNIFVVVHGPGLLWHYFWGFLIMSSWVSYLPTLQCSMLISGFWSNEVAKRTRLYVHVKSLALWDGVWSSAGCNAYITSALRFIYYEGPLCRATCSGLWKRQLLKGAWLLLLQKSRWEQWLGGEISRNLQSWFVSGYGPIFCHGPLCLHTALGTVHTRVSPHLTSI